MMFGRLKNIDDDKGDVIVRLTAADRQLCSSERPQVRSGFLLFAGCLTFVLCTGVKDPRCPRALVFLRPSRLRKWNSDLHLI